MALGLISKDAEGHSKPKDPISSDVKKGLENAEKKAKLGNEKTKGGASTPPPPNDDAPTSNAEGNANSATTDSAVPDKEMLTIKHLADARRQYLNSATTDSAIPDNEMLTVKHLADARRQYLAKSAQSSPSGGTDPWGDGPKGGGQGGDGGTGGAGGGESGGGGGKPGGGESGGGGVGIVGAVFGVLAVFDITQDVANKHYGSAITKSGLFIAAQKIPGLGEILFGLSVLQESHDPKIHNMSMSFGQKVENATGSRVLGGLGAAGAKVFLSTGAAVRDMIPEPLRRGIAFFFQTAATSPGSFFSPGPATSFVMHGGYGGLLRSPLDTQREINARPRR